MGGPQASETADIADGEPWAPPGMGPLRKVGLTVLMVMLGVIPGLLLLASDPLPDPSDEVASGPRSSGDEARDEAPVGDAAPAPEASRPETPASTPDTEDGVGDVESGQDGEEREGRADRPQRRSPAVDGLRDREAEDHEDADDDADDDPDDDGPLVSLRLGGWG